MISSNDAPYCLAELNAAKFFIKLRMFSLLKRHPAVYMRYEKILFSPRSGTISFYFVIKNKEKNFNFTRKEVNKNKD